MKITEALEQIKKEDSERAFRYIYDTSYERIFRTAYYYIKNDEYAREITIDVLASLWNNRKTMIIPQDFYAYCFVATKNMALNRLRSSKAQVQYDIESVEAASTETPEQQLIDEEIFMRYENALHNLPERCRQVFTLVKEDGKTYAEVASLMEISTKTVDAQIQKATKEIREALSAYIGKKTSSARSRFILSLL